MAEWMATLDTMLGVYTAFLCFTGHYAHSGWNQTAADIVEPWYTCVCDPPCRGQSLCSTPGMCYVHKHADTQTRNCFPTVEQSLLSCHSHAQSQFLRCCQGNMCNLDLTVILPDNTDRDEVSSNLTLTLITTASAALSACMVVMAAIYLVRRRAHMLKTGSLLLAPGVKLLDEDSLYKEFQDSSKQDQWSSGSGSGQPTLVPRTVGKQVTLIERIGKGRFGEVWRGKLLDEDVAVKTFSSLDEMSWKQETDIYNTGMLHHDNILGYFASDTVGILSCTQNWLILQYHRNGSLYDYLQRSDLDMEEMLLLAYSAAAGLAHLHTEIKEGTGKHGKPAIAHRDIKSKNILVKDNGQCCIGDLGHAVSSSLSREMEPGRLLVGTKRYMAPEVLAETLTPHLFEAFKCVDVYAFGLVLWELARRARPYSDEYRIPFWDLVPADPSFEDMKRLVVLDQHRPPIPNKWAMDSVMYQVAGLMSGCWTHDPKSRLTILRVKKNMCNLLRSVAGGGQADKKLAARFVDGNSTSSSGNSASYFSGHL